MVAAYGLLLTQRTIGAAGVIKGVELGVYFDVQCANATSFLDFGQLEPGSSKNYTLHLRNEGNSAMILNMTSEDWNPTIAADHISLTWNREGYQINADDIIDFIITLKISDNIVSVDSFSLNIVISGQG